MANFLDDLRNQIRGMPDKIKEANNALQAAKNTLRKRKSEYKLAEANSYLAQTGTPQERKAKALVACQDSFELVLQAEEAVATAETALEHGNDVFVALRKEASMVEAELKNLNNQL